MKTQKEAPVGSKSTPDIYQSPTIRTIALEVLWQRLGPAVALTSSPDLFESLVPSDPADGLFDD